MTFFFLTLTKALASMDMRDIYTQYYSEMEAFLRGLYEKGIDDAIFTRHNAKAGAIALLSALDGVLVYLVMNQAADKEEVIRGFEEKFVTSLLLPEK